MLIKAQVSQSAAQDPPTRGLFWLVVTMFWKYGRERGHVDLASLITVTSS
jgi:hypothetical protein